MSGDGGDSDGDGDDDDDDVVSSSQEKLPCVQINVENEDGRRVVDAETSLWSEEHRAAVTDETLQPSMSELRWKVVGGPIRLHLAVPYFSPCDFSDEGERFIFSSFYGETRRLHHWEQISFRRFRKPLPLGYLAGFYLGGGGPMLRCDWLLKHGTETDPAEKHQKFNFIVLNFVFLL